VIVLDDEKKFGLSRSRCPLLYHLEALLGLLVCW
jgi:hypothetical protein